jgi:hypothetical protein
MTAKDKHKINLLKYLGDPENDFPTARQDYTKILDISIATLYGHFSPQDFQDIEAEAYDLRKKNSSKQRAVLLKTLYTEGKGGSVPAIKEFLDRTEGKVSDKLAVSGKVDMNIAVEIIDSTKRITD